MHGTDLREVCSHFDVTDFQSGQSVGTGLINHSYKVLTTDGNTYFLQKINTAVFTNPSALQNNYVRVQQHLSGEGSMQLPKLIQTISGEFFYNNGGEVWRCFEFLKNTYSPQTIETPEKAYEVANCFGSFSAALQSLDDHQLATILPHFHNLALRFQQFEGTLQTASEQKKKEVKNLVEEIEKYSFLVKWFSAIYKDKKHFPLHILHHDCKIANILFDKDTDAIRCPIDLDTTQPGLFFSDIGDMLRTSVPNLQEDDANIDALAIRPLFFDAINEGYLDAMASLLTREEKENLHYAGIVLVYMQALRFLTDYLNGNVYYKTSYPEQNKDRTANQLRLLHLLHQFLVNNKRSFVR